MRAGLSTIQQTLTPEAATALNDSIAEAGRRNHGQTTPLHVAATLLATPSGFLRQACVRSHPNSSHPLQGRALELCFGVALDRLPTAPNAGKPGAEPPINNALMAALKRAQANQRRGCPEQQQQPLLAVKVELEQLILSILDDPSVSRVMREASFSSPAVKASIEESLTSSNPQTHPPPQVGSFGTTFGGILPRVPTFPSQLPTPLLQNPSPAPPSVNRNAYLNPRLQPAGAGKTPGQRGEDVKKVMEIMARSKKRNPILVGDSELESVVKELLIQTQNMEVLKNVQIISLEKGYFSDKNQIPTKIKELGSLIEGKIGTGGVILDLGDLKWLVEQPVSFGGVHQQKPISESGRAAVIEMGSLLARFGGGGGGGAAADNKLWLIGTATCETYLRCQVYHSTMENDWDLQAVPITSRSPLTGLVPRLGTERSLSNQVESLAPLKIAATPLQSLARVESDSAQRMTFCPECTKKYETELSKLTAIERSFSESKQEERTPSLPQWLQNAKLAKSDSKSDEPSQGKKLGLVTEQKLQELQKKWKDTCLHLHPSFHQNHRSVKPNHPILSMPNLLNPNLLSRSPFQPKPLAKKPLGESLQLNLNQVATQQHADRGHTPPTSPVQTDLVLGREGPDKNLEKWAEDQAKDFLGCISSEPQSKFLDKFATALDADTYKKLLKGLMEKAWWQAEAASAVASAITRCRLGNGKRRGGGSRGDVWLLFMGPDRVAKKKMASVLAQQICGTSPVTISLGSRKDGETDFQFRGKTAIDRIAEAIRRNPVSVIVLEDIDEADILLRGNVNRAIERGRLTDSHFREVGLGNTIFVLTGDWSSTDPKSFENGNFVDERKSPSDWRLGLILREKSSKRRAPWLRDDDRRLNPREKMGSGLSLDLNLAAADTEEDDVNSSSLTIEFEDELNVVNAHFSTASVPHELVNNVDDAILFKPVDLAFVRREIKKTISVKFSMVVEDKLSIEVEDDVVERILGGLWHDDRTSLEAWIGEVVAPSFDRLKMQLTSGDSSRSVARLVVESDGRKQEKGLESGNWLPRSITVQGVESH